MRCLVLRWLTILVLLSLQLGALQLPSAAGSPTPPNAADATAYNSLMLYGGRPVPPPFADLTGNIEIPYADALNAAFTAFTAEAWVDAGFNSGCQTVVGNGWGQSYWFGLCNGRLRFHPHGSNGFAESTGTVQSGWTHIGITYDTGVTRFYLNGLLDSASSSVSGPMSGAPAGQWLGIGFDIDDNFTPNYYGPGFLQEVRLWNVVRSAADIKASLFQVFGSAQPGLLAEWRLNGNADDALGGHNGQARRTVNWGNAGALPHDVRIPVASGACLFNPNAQRITLGRGSVYLMHTATDLWICVTGLDLPTGGHDSWVAVYLDAEHDRVNPAQPNHFSFEAHSNYTGRLRVGDGSGDYALSSLPDGSWSASYNLTGGDFPTVQASFRISSSLVQGWSHVAGLAIAQHALSGPGDDRVWPARGMYNLPSTWSSVTLAGSGPPRTFSGSVRYQPRDVSAKTTPVAGATISLIGSDANGSEAATVSTTSNPDGTFSLSSSDDFGEHRLKLSDLPQGYSPFKAWAPAPGSAVDATTITYGSAGGGTYSGSAFTLVDASPFLSGQVTGPYFLIVAPNKVVDAGALDNFTAFKRRQGFEVEVARLENVADQNAGADIGAKVRALELARKQTYGSRFQYVMLIGPHALIPYRLVPSWSDLAGQTCTGFAPPAGVAFSPTDWYYVDLTSDWDSNGNGCLADGLWKTNPPAANPDSGITFAADVKLGRLPLADPAAVRTVLSNTMGFEQQAGSYKHNVLLGMSMSDLKGVCWDPAQNAYVTTGCMDKIAYGTDGSYLGHALTGSFLDADQYDSQVFYENEPESIGGSPYHSPQPLADQSVPDSLKAGQYGMLNMAGHGNSSGSFRVHWDDLNQDGIAQSPDQAGYHEQVWGTIASNDTLNSVPPANERSPIVFTESCSTGQYNDPNNMGATLLSQGRGVAFIGGLDMTGYAFSWKEPGNGAGQDLDYFTTRRLLHDGQRLGDALWLAGHEKAADATPIAFDLFGDPTLSYWGNPGGETTQAAWPMLRQTAAGQARSDLFGPTMPVSLWNYQTGATPSGTLPPSPLVSNNGEVIVTHGSAVDVLRQGSLAQALALNAAAWGTPALAADGTLYVWDVTGVLYAFGYENPYAGVPLRDLRWKTTLGTAPDTSPVIGSDGLIALGYTAGSEHWVALLRPDGFEWRKTSVAQPALTALAIDGNRVVYATTADSIKRIDFYCEAAAPCVTSAGFSSKHFTTPPLVLRDRVYAGLDDGTVVRKNLNLVTTASYQADGAIVAGPIAGGPDRIVVLSQNHTLYGLSNDLDPHWSWQRSLDASVNLGMPAFSANALYVSAGDTLRAFDPVSGVPQWTVMQGSGTEDGSVAVGYGREIYVRTRSGALMAVGEGWSQAPASLKVQPGGVSADHPYGVMQITWYAPGRAAEAGPDEASAASGFLIQRRVPGGPWSDLVNLPGSARSYSDAQILPGLTYLYRVQRLSANGRNSEFVNGQGSVRSLPHAPRPPELLSVDPLPDTGLRLTWQPAEGSEVTAYNIQIQLSPMMAWLPVATTTGATTQYADTGLAPGHSYRYRVFAVNANGMSAASNEMPGRTRSRTLAAPQALQAQVGPGNRVTLSWGRAPAGATAVIEINPSHAYGYTPLGTGDAGQPFGVTLDTPDAYAFRAKFVKDDGESDYAYVLQRVRTANFTGGWRWQVYLPLVMSGDQR